MRLRTRLTILVVALIAVLAIAAPVGAVTPAYGVLHTGLPNRVLTPGALNPAVTQATIGQTICVSGWTATIRPSSTYTTNLKRTQLATYGFADRTLSHYEEDHLISLELGGNPRSTKNLWPEPYHITVGGSDVGAYTKDAFETYLKRQVCAGKLSLATAQSRIAKNWVYYWRLWKTGSGTAPVPTATPHVNPNPAPTTSGLPASVAQAKAAGASAVCSDGTWSYSAHRSGTCSHHGGVYWWTGNLGPAGPG